MRSLSLLSLTLLGLSVGSLSQGVGLPKQWSIVQAGTTGVSAVQLVVVSETKMLILDKPENNPLMVNGHSAWASEVDLNTRAIRPVTTLSNPFCGSGNFLSNGTFISSGGDTSFTPDDLNGLQAIRLFNPCGQGNCNFVEYHTRVRLATKRWYPSTVRLEDGSLMIYGGSTSANFINHKEVNEPTYEYYPPKNILGFNGLPIPAPFLIDTLNANGFPVMHLLPSGKIFIAANRFAIILDRLTGVETRLPDIPNGVRVSYPFTAASTLLPLTPENNYAPEVLLCGGSTVSDTIDGSQMSPQDVASSQCARMLLTDAGISQGWKTENMPTPRVMSEAVILPDQKILIVNGAETGLGGYGNVANTIGESNADNPCYTPLLYDPAAPAGQRFTSVKSATSSIPRLYHSVASLTPNGTVVLAGSNPNSGVTYSVPYSTEYRIEWISPPYMFEPRPTYSGLPKLIKFGSTFKLSVNLPSTTQSVTVVLIDIGFATHNVHMDQRLVVLKSSLSSNKKSLTVTAPPSGFIYPPGPAFLYVVTNGGVPSPGKRTIIGTGASPPVDQGAINNMLSNTKPPARTTPGEGRVE